MNNLISIHDPATGRQANNMIAANLPEVIRPWFADFSDDERIAHAVDELEDARTRKNALRYLGLELFQVA